MVEFHFTSLWQKGKGNYASELSTRIVVAIEIVYLARWNIANSEQQQLFLDVQTSLFTMANGKVKILKSILTPQKN